MCGQTLLFIVIANDAIYLMLIGALVVTRTVYVMAPYSRRCIIIVIISAFRVLVSDG